jgi:thiol-disulfide isomerase/thioredoxin
MNKVIVTLGLMCVLTSPLAAQTSDERYELNKPIPIAARRLAIHGVELAARDRAEAGVVLLKKAIALAPNYVWAHHKYVQVRTFNQGQYDDVRAEYDRLMSKEPDNPIYPLIIAETSFGLSESTRPLYERVVELAPNWAWAHYAKAHLYIVDGNIPITEMRNETKQLMVAEIRKCIELDPTTSAYSWLVFVLVDGLGSTGEAISVAEKWADQPEYRAEALKRLWQLRLAKEKESAEAKTSLGKELTQLLQSTRDVKTLAAVRSAYLDLLKDAASADKAKSAIQRIDPAWYPEQGEAWHLFWRDESGIPHFRPVVNHQAAIFHQINQLDDANPKEKILGLENLLSQKLGRELRIHIYQQILRAAERVKDDPVYIKYGEAWRLLEPGDAGLLAKLAIARANQNLDLARALGYAQLAERATTEFRPAQRPRNSPPEWFAWQFPETQQRSFYKSVRARALDALGWVLYRMGDYAAAEDKLRQSCAIIRGERNLLHLSESLRKLGRSNEAEAAARDANNIWLESLKRQMVSRPSSDFRLDGLAGLRIKLSDLKGKVVLIDFWATWCAPCEQEMPHLVKLYEKYKDRGFEILAISVDSKSELYKVGPFANTHKLNFPVLFDDGVSGLYQVRAYPTTIFIDRSGNVRYSASGFDADRARVIEAVINELLK